MSRLEILQARMRDEQTRKAAKEAAMNRIAKTVCESPKVKSVKPVKVAARFLPPVESERMEFDPHPTLLEAVQKLSPAEASDPKSIAFAIALFVVDELMKTPRQCALLSDNMSDDLAWITSAPFAEKINVKRIISTALTLADSIECRSQGGEGSGISKLHEIERALLQRQKGAL